MGTVSDVFLASDFDSIQSEEIKHVYISSRFYNTLFLFVKRMFLYEIVRNDLKVV